MSEHLSESCLYNKKVNMAFRNLMLNVKMQIDHFEIVGELQIGGTSVCYLIG